MELFFEGPAHVKFKTSVVGVTFDNPDGSNRQEILEHCKKAQLISLVREYDNPHDTYAIQVLTTSGSQIGYIPSGDQRLYGHIDRGGITTARIHSVTGGHSFLDRLRGNKGKTYGCVLEIEKAGLDPDKFQESYNYSQIDTKIRDILHEAYQTENIDISKAIELYRKGIEEIINLDERGIMAKANRRNRIPINRISILLERINKEKEAWDYLEWYSNYDDYLGLTKTEKISYDKRLNRLRKRIITSDRSQSKESLENAFLNTSTTHGIRNENQREGDGSNNPPNTNEHLKHQTADKRPEGSIQQRRRFSNSTVVALISLFVLCLIIIKISQNRDANENVEVEKLFPEKKRRSSYLKSQGILIFSSSDLFSETNRYSANNLIDRNKSTPWVEGVSGYGINEFVNVDLLSVQDIAGITILNGYNLTKSDFFGDRWKRNSRLKQLEIIFNNEITKTLHLEDRKGFQHFYFNPVPSREIRLIIKDVYHGDEMDNTAISEIGLIGSR